MCVCAVLILQSVITVGFNMTVFIYANMYGIFVINLPSLKQEIEVS